MKWNNYFEEYRRHFPSDPKRIVEIGVGKGDGLRWLRKTYPTAHLIGIDRQLSCYHDANCEVIWANQCHFYNEIIARIGFVDIIIDDGGHRPYQQAASFKRLWPFLRDGGIYAIEDMHLGQRLRWRIFSKFFGIQKVLNKLTSQMSKWDGAETAGYRSPLSVMYFPQLILIKKGETFIHTA
jgi:hypothetical protein